MCDDLLSKLDILYKNSKKLESGSSSIFVPPKGHRERIEKLFGTTTKRVNNEHH